MLWSVLESDLDQQTGRLTWHEDLLTEAPLLRCLDTVTCACLCRFVMWYEGVADDGTRSIGIAVSDDGISDWIRRDR